MPDEPRHNRRDAPFAVSQASQTRAPNAPTLTSSFLSRKRRKSTFQATKWNKATSAVKLTLAKQQKRLKHLPAGKILKMRVTRCNVRHPKKGWGRHGDRGLELRGRGGLRDSPEDAAGSREAEQPAAAGPEDLHARPGHDSPIVWLRPSSRMGAPRRGRRAPRQSRAPRRGPLSASLSGGRSPGLPPGPARRLEAGGRKPRAPPLTPAAPPAPSAPRHPDPETPSPRSLDPPNPSGPKSQVSVSLRRSTTQDDEGTAHTGGRASGPPRPAPPPSPRRRGRRGRRAQTTCAAFCARASQNKREACPAPPAHVTAPRPAPPLRPARAVRFSRLNLAAFRPLPCGATPCRGPESDSAEGSGPSGCGRSPAASAPLPAPPPSRRGAHRPARRGAAGHSPAGAPWLPSAAAPSARPWWAPLRWSLAARPPASPPGAAACLRASPAPAAAAAAV
ncbi:basic proline-rich protein-like [Equus quagga]|uniref:basic proline-rich protein-like n=1 Tax=Equus quagga TaxID=89248 RepID=UPI001EE2345D|nr:basic proline-rich protein-like [Equus quagga]